MSHICNISVEEEKLFDLKESFSSLACAPLPIITIGCILLPNMSFDLKKEMEPSSLGSKLDGSNCSSPLNLSESEALLFSCCFCIEHRLSRENLACSK